MLFGYYFLKNFKNVCLWGHLSEAEIVFPSMLYVEEFSIMRFSGIILCLFALPHHKRAVFTRLCHY